MTFQQTHLYVIKGSSYFLPQKRYNTKGVHSYKITLTIIIIISIISDVDPESMDFTNISNWSANVSAMMVSSEEEMSEDSGNPADPNRKHIVYQSCLAELIGKVSVNLSSQH